MGEKSAGKKVNRSLVNEILNFMQSMEYTPKPLSWFLCAYYADLEELQQVMNYLVADGCIKKNDEDMYEVMRDLRFRVCGKFFADGLNGGYVEPDLQRIMQPKIYVPKKWCMGAMQNDRVVVAVNGIGHDDDETMPTGAVEEILCPFGDSFCGIVRYIRKQWYVVPFDVRVGTAIPIEEEPSGIYSGDSVFARLTNGEEFRLKAFVAADIRQKEKTIVWSKISSGKSEAVQKIQEKRCRVLCKVFDCAERFAYENRLHRMFGKEALFDAHRHERLKRTSEMLKRRDLTDLETYITAPDCAFSVFRENGGFRIFAHVPDLTEYVLPGSVLDKELSEKGYLPDFLPRRITEACAFAAEKQRNAITAEFVTDKTGNLVYRTMYRSEILCGDEKTPAFDEAETSILADDPFCASHIASAAEFAVMDFFDEASYPAPYLNLYESDDWSTIRSIAEKLGFDVRGEDLLSQINAILRSAKRTDRRKDALILVRRGAREMPDWIRHGVTGRVDFLRPFSSYLSIAAQHAFVQMHKRQSREEYAAFASRMREITALFLRQREAYTSYQRILDNCAFFEQDRKMARAVYRATVINCMRSCGGIYLLCDGIVGYLTGRGNAHLETGDTVAVVLERMRADGMWLYFRRATGAGMPLARGIIYETKQNNLKKSDSQKGY